MTSSEGTRLRGGAYEIRGVLGEGAQGTTYEALATETQRAVAIKRFDVRGAKGWKDVELAEREARVLATLDHPLLPRYVEHFEEEGALYFVMEKVEGETLEALRRRHGAFSESEVRRFLACADRALTYLHGRGAPVIHRDIKPRNVIRRPDGTYVFVDFGAVRERIQRRDGSTVVGTMGFMAPEQFQGRAFPQTDVFAVGATALAALTGAEPETLPHRGLRIDVRAALGNRVSAALVDALEKMVEPDPDVRVASVALALEGVHQAGSVPPPIPPTRTTPGSQEVLSGERDASRKIIGVVWPLWGGLVVMAKGLSNDFGHPGLGKLVVVVGFFLALTLTLSAEARSALRRTFARADVKEPASPSVPARSAAGARGWRRLGLAVLFAVLALHFGKSIGRPRAGMAFTFAALVAAAVVIGSKRERGGRAAGTDALDAGRSAIEHARTVLRHRVAGFEPRVRVQATELPLAAQLGQTEVQTSREERRMSLHRG